MKGAFVTSTGTDIGKTFVMAGLIGAMRRAGHPVIALKPVASGFDPSRPQDSDAAVLLTALDRPVTLAKIEAISPWRFRAPLSPDMAARREGRAIDFAALIDFCRDAAARREFALIEGVGGVMVPLGNQHTVLDWIAALSMPVVLVAGSYLGAISHTLTALDVVTHRHLQIAALLICESEASHVSPPEMVEVIARFHPESDIILLPRLSGCAAQHRRFDRATELCFRAQTIT